MFKKILLAGAALWSALNVASAKELKSIGISLGSMGNPFFVALSKGAEFEAKKTNPEREGHGGRLRLRSGQAEHADR